MKIPVGLALLFALSSGCHTHLLQQQGSFVTTDSLAAAEDDKLRAGIAPYKAQIDEEMNTVIGQSPEALTKQQPESTMGNWISDAVTKKAGDYIGQPIDFGVLNQGGLRVGALPQGAVSKRHIFEVLPFDNQVVVVEMPGSELPRLFQHVADKGGWPLSAAVRLRLSGGRVSEIRIGNQPIEPERVYMIATNDYMANGGDNCTFFVGKKQWQTGKFLRDAVLAFCEELQAAGLPIQSQLQGRITIE